MIIIKAHITPDKRSTLEDFFKKIKELDPEKEYKVFVTDQKKSRTLRQNAYYWGVVIPIIAGHTGHTKEEVHELCKFKFNKQIVADPETGEMLEIGMSTANLKTDDFSNYVEAIKAWAMELECYIPEAGETPDEVVILHKLV